MSTLRYILLILAGISLYSRAWPYATALRGYRAIGGEAVLLILPLAVWWIVKWAVPETVEAMRIGMKEE